MSQNTYNALKHRYWIRLRTLVLLRWWAIIGQTSALIIAQRLYNLDVETGMCYAVIGISIISNLVAAFIYPENKRLSESETFFVVLFDLLQLGLMLYLTGGLNNPFSILIVGPVTVSASALSARSTAALGLVAIAIVSVLLFYYLPLRTDQGSILYMPDIFRLGNWAAIIIGIIFLGVYSRWIVSEMSAMYDALQATQMALAREQKLTDLGGVVAAAAHEMGTPLATIKLTSSELADELSDNEDLKSDALLIREQADRCRDILRSMGRAGKDDLQMRYAPISTVIEEAAEPHADRGKLLNFDYTSASKMNAHHPVIQRRPEIIHGLRNLIQNAVDFAHSTVWIETHWSADKITIRIMDDGKGYPIDMIGRIGDPFMRRRAAAPDPRRPGYDGMGLGLFIAKTLLERSGADLSFANGAKANNGRLGQSKNLGAIVEVSWPRAQLEADDRADRKPLGENQPHVA